MPLRYLATAGLLFGLSTPLFAQDAVPAYRFYAGLTAYSSGFQPLGGQSYLDGGSYVTVPVQAVFGYQVGRRWAVQLGAAYSGYQRAYGFGYQYDTTTPNGTTTTRSYYHNGTYTVRKLSLALMGRYTLTRTPTRRFQVDALGGVTTEHSIIRDAGNQSSIENGSLSTNNYDSTEHEYRLLAGAGTGLRFRAARRLDVMFDFVLNLPLYSSSGFDLTSATALGLRYRFGQPN